MPAKKSDKKIPALSPNFESILVCNNSHLRPFVEVFIFEAENITQKNLGTLFGVFEITDTSEDSSYIVNYLSSVIKKEYFSRPKRAPIESLEAALHRANLALSKIAEHGNVKWIGKLNALVAIIEKNNLHLAQAGTASAFLLRSKGLTDISEGLSGQESEPHPLKTFINVSSGRLEEGDKIIVTTDEIFEIFSLEEIKKSALRFDNEKFTQFLKTALGNELESAAVLVADIKEKEELPKTEDRKNTQAVNAFSQAAFFKEPAAANQGKVSREAARQIAEEVSKDEKNAQDERSGHIYIKETMEERLGNKAPNEYWIMLSEWALAVKNSLRKNAKRFGLFLSDSVKKITLPKIKMPTIDSRSKLESFSSSEKNEAENQITGSPQASTSNEAPQETPAPMPAQKEPLSFFEKIRNASDTPKEIPAVDYKSEFSLETKIFTDKAKKALSFARPNLSRIREISSKMDYQQKLYALLIILAIIFVPYFGLKLNSYIQSKKTPTVAPVAEVAPPLEEDKLVSRVGTLNSVYSSNDIISTLNINGKVLAISESQIADLETKETVSLPADFGKITLVTGMDDLNLVFLMNQSGRIISYSPVAKKFQDNTIAIPSESSISAAGTYLTYLYLVDSKNNQILRYPRSGSGFGESVSWLKDSLNLSKTTGIALNDNIFLADGKDVSKLFKGTRQDFKIENTATPIAPFKIFTKPDFSYVYVLDKVNSRIIKIDPAGIIMAQYYNSEIASALDFTVDEPNNIAYIAISSALKSFSLNQQ